MIFLKVILLCLRKKKKKKKGFSFFLETVFLISQITLRKYFLNGEVIEERREREKEIGKKRERESERGERYKNNKDQIKIINQIYLIKNKKQKNVTSNTRNASKLYRRTSFG